MSPKRNLLQWIPTIILAAAFALLWGTAHNGGEQGVLAWLLLRSGLPYLGSIFLIGVVGASIWKRRLNKPMWISLLFAVFTIWPAFWSVWPLALKYPVTIEQMTPAATVRLPADAPLRVAWGGDSVWTNYHATYPDQRWAYDLVIDPAFSGSSSLEDYGCWGVPVVAPASGEVVFVQDGEPDYTPGRDSEGYTHPAGNHVFVKLETGTFLAIGHLQQGSIVVQKGDLVTEGQVVGKCGNSGSTSEPHIHIHHQRQSPESVPLGLAEGLPLYFRDHDGQPMPEGGYNWKDGRFVPNDLIVQPVGH